MSKDKSKDSGKDKSDEITNPALYAGLKFYDVLMKKQNAFSAASYTGDLSLWRHALEDYYASTKSYMSATNAADIQTQLRSLDVRISNFIQYKERLGNAAQQVHNVLVRDLFKLQTDIMVHTEHLNLKTSKGDNGKFDARRLFST